MLMLLYCEDICTFSSQKKYVIIKFELNHTLTGGLVPSSTLNSRSSFANALRSYREKRTEETEVYNVFSSAWLVSKPEEQQTISHTSTA